MALIGFLGVCLFAVIIFVWFITSGPMANDERYREGSENLFKKTVIICTVLIILLGLIGSFIY